MTRYVLLAYNDDGLPPDHGLSVTVWGDHNAWDLIDVRIADVTDLVEADLNDPELGRGHGLSFPMARAVERLA